MGKLGFVVPTLACVDIEIRLEEGVDGLHADVELERVKMRVVFHWHRREAYSVVVADTLVEEEALDAERHTVKCDLWLRRCYDVNHPELVNEVQTAVGACDGRVNHCGQSQSDGFLI